MTALKLRIKSLSCPQGRLRRPKPVAALSAFLVERLTTDPLSPAPSPAPCAPLACSRCIVARALTYPMDGVCGRDNVPPRAGKTSKSRRHPPTALTTPEKIRTLQRKLYRKAKEKSRRAEDACIHTPDRAVRRHCRASDSWRAPPSIRRDDFRRYGGIG